MTGPGIEGAAAATASIGEVSERPGSFPGQSPANQSQAYQAAATAFVVLFCIVGIAVWGLPFYYDFMVQQFG